MTNEIHPSSLAHQIQQFHEAIRGRVPEEVATTLSRELVRLAESGIVDGSLRTGSSAPDFALPDQSGETVQLSKLLRNGPAVVTFYRGGWCLYCNLQLRAYQAVLPSIAARGARLVAISPRTPDFTLSTVQEKGLAFPVFSDVGNYVARRYGLVFVLSDALQDLQKKFENEVPRFNGDSWELPMPGTFIISTDRPAGVGRFRLPTTARARRDPRLPRESLAETYAGAGSQPGTLAASTSTRSIFGSCASRSGAFAIRAAAMGPARCACRPDSPGNASKIPNVDGPRRTANQTIVSGSFKASASPPVRNSESADSLPGFASRRTMSPTVTMRFLPFSLYRRGRTIIGLARRVVSLVRTKNVASDEMVPLVRRKDREITVGPTSTYLRCQ
jgi:peroxiredoxin